MMPQSVQEEQEEAHLNFWRTMWEAGNYMEGVWSAQGSSLPQCWCTAIKHQHSLSME